MLELLQIWIRWWKQIAVFTVLAMLLSIVLSIPAIMPPYYASKMIFYPSNPAASDRTVLFKEDGIMLDYFGGKDDINRFLAIANSSALVGFIVDSFQLREHYNIDEAGYFYVAREFRGNYKAIKNTLGAIEVEILDTDPILAAKMVKAAVIYIDAANRKMLNDNKQKTLDVLLNEYDIKKSRLELLADSLSVLKKTNPYSYDKDGNLIGAEKLRLLDATVKNLTNDVNQLLTMANQFEVSLADNYTSLHVVEDAAIPERKTKPVRWMIVLATLVGAFITATLTVIIIELIRHARDTAQPLDA
jgi:capsular polysaccharide biosynthesis protein